MRQRYSINVRVSPVDQAPDGADGGDHQDSEGVLIDGMREYVDQRRQAYLPSGACDLCSIHLGKDDRSEQKLLSRARDEDIEHIEECRLMGSGRAERTEDPSDEQDGTDRSG